MVKTTNVNEVSGVMNLVQTDRPVEIQRIDKTVHTAIRAWALALGEHALPIWSEAPQWAKESTRASVDYVLNNPDVTPEGLHDFWRSHRQSISAQIQQSGFNERVAKTSREYENLSLMERGKDILVIELTQMMAASAGIRA